IRHKRGPHLSTHGTSSASSIMSLGAALRDLPGFRRHADADLERALKMVCSRCRHGHGARALAVPRFIKQAIVGVTVITVGLFLGRSLFDSLVARLDHQRAVHEDQTAVTAGVQAQVKPKVLLVYRNKEGRRIRVLADEEQFSAFVRAQVAQLEQARRALAARAAQRLRARTAPAFSAMQQRVDAFADWYFAWSTTYDLAAKAIISSVSNAFRPGVMGVGEAVEYDLERYIERHYRDIVLRPEQSDTALAQGYRETLSDLYQDFLSSMATFDEAFQNFVASNTTYLAEPVDTQETRLVLDWDSQVKKLSLAGYEHGLTRPALGAALVTGMALAGRTGGAAAGKVFAQAALRRSAAAGARGVGARLAAPYLGRVAATATGATIGAVSGPAGAILGAAAGLGGDYLLNEAVEFVKRDGFEAEVLATLEAQERNWQATMLPSLEGAVDTWFGDMIQLLVSYDAL
ncbi:MAG: hypothetical protein WAN46_19485, partial [Gammaproteobacteria bacterium]